ncbi:MAG TPA: diguanylate cyclase [Clostridia bacterium]|nr:diguanylate cyclase [Clostridia bacterium]
MLKTLDAAILSFIVLALLVFDSRKRPEKQTILNWLFFALLCFNIFMLVLDLATWAVNGVKGELYRTLSVVLNFFLFSLAPFGIGLWLLYSDYYIFKDTGRLKRILVAVSLFLGLNAALCFINIYTGWYYTIDAANVYSRSSLSWVYVIFNYSLLLYSLIHILRHKKRLESRHFISMLLFYLPAVAGIALQWIVYGVNTNWIGMMLSLLIVYLSMQEYGLNTDYLTGAYNRRQLDNYIRTKIKLSRPESIIGVICVDLNEFKLINDNYGHEAGDKALKAAVAVLRKSLRPNDFIARTGGDEFVILLDDLNSPDMLVQIVNRIQVRLDAHNASRSTPYKLVFSMGYDCYDKRTGMPFETFLKHVDALMYKNKSEIKRREAQLKALRDSFANNPSSLLYSKE